MIGQNIGKYRVLDRVGRGGMGTVYRAIDETLHREVAIKVLNAELNDPEVAKRFRAEAITVARLSHPGIATIYELFQHDGQWLMVMEFVRGETLEHVIATKGPLPADRAARLCMQSLAALAHAHSMGVVHRDLKPANIMLTDAGDIKIMDFGIARVTGTEHLTNVGFMMGTPAYMAPEQVLGQEIDARADLYAMGVVLFRLLTGQLPFKGDSPFAMAQAQVNSVPTPVSALRSDLPTWVEQVIARSLEKKPEARFQSAVEFHDALDRSLSGDPPPATYHSSAPANLVSTPSRAMPTGQLERESSAGHEPPGSDAPTMLSPTPPRGDRTGRVASTPSFDPASVAPTIAAPTPVTVERQVVQPSPSSEAAVLSAPSAPPVGPAHGARVSSGSGRAISLGAAAAVLVSALAAGAWWMSRSPDVETAAGAETTAAIETAPAETVDAESRDIALAAPVPAASQVVTPVETASDGATDESADDSAESRPDAFGLSTAADEAVPPVEVANVKAMIVDGRKAEDEDVTLTFDADRLSVTGVRAGNTLATMAYADVAAATYVRARNPRWDKSLASPPDNLDVGGVFRASRHWLMLQSASAYLLLRLEDINVIHTLREIEARTGVTVQRPGN